MSAPNCSAHDHELNADCRSGGQSIVIDEQHPIATPAQQRPAWQQLIESARSGDHIIVDDFGALGADLDDVAETLRRLERSGITLTVLKVASPSREVTTVSALLNTVEAVSSFLKASLVERVKAGHTRARSAGKNIGRPSKLDEQQRERIAQMHAAGRSIASLARQFRVSRGSIKRIVD